MRTLSLCAVGMVAVVCLIATVVVPMSSGSDEGRTQTFDVAPGHAITLDLKSGGSVTITGWDQPKAEVYCVQSGKGHQHKIEVVEQGGGLLVTSVASPRDGQARSLSFEIKVPRQSDVIFESAGGSLEIVGLEGDFRGKTMGGGLTMSDTDGTVDLQTMGGDIEVSNAALDGDISTMGGDVTLTDVVGDLDAETMGGNVQCNNVSNNVSRYDGKPRAVAGDGPVDMTTMGGDIVLDEAPAGASLHTMGGDIIVKDASVFVKATTMGGNVDLRVTDGWVDATTMAGRIGVVVEEGLGGGGEGVKLSSCCGDAELVVPADLSMDLDLTIAYTRNSSQDFRIISDFDVRTEHSAEWDYTNGSPKKRIHGTGVVAGGKYPVVIETVNGDIRVLKAK